MKQPAFPPPFRHEHGSKKNVNEIMAFHYRAVRTFCRTGTHSMRIPQLSSSLPQKNIM